jgi:hypothetical protein
VTRQTSANFGIANIWARHWNNQQWQFLFYFSLGIDEQSQTLVLNFYLYQKANKQLRHIFYFMKKEDMDLPFTNKYWMPEAIQ